MLSGVASSHSNSLTQGGLVWCSWAVFSPWSLWFTCNELHCCTLCSYLEKKYWHLTIFLFFFSFWAIEDKLMVVKSFVKIFCKMCIFCGCNFQFHFNVKYLRQIWKLNLSHRYISLLGFPVVKNPPAVQETQEILVPSLAWKDPWNRK